ncbi:hypothetical protein AB1Y20_009065 [Prymnesium parvum]|uniref:Uncharacterized protein n=1 Tax=Prymnesium parvum TaxID=97485 RepID=A0AB34K5L1_PRYPA
MAPITQGAWQLSETPLITTDHRPLAQPDYSSSTSQSPRKLIPFGRPDLYMHCVPHPKLLGSYWASLCAQAKALLEMLWSAPKPIPVHEESKVLQVDILSEPLYSRDVPERTELAMEVSAARPPTRPALDTTPSKPAEMAIAMPADAPLPAAHALSPAGLSSGPGALATSPSLSHPAVREAADDTAKSSGTASVLAAAHPAPSVPLDHPGEVAHGTISRVATLPSKRRSSTRRLHLSYTT